jgi:hypothetical protein
MTIKPVTNSTKSLTKRALAAALLAAAAALSGAALVDPAIASAFPSESVRNAYADCVNKVATTDPGYDANVKKCCLDGGGTYTDGPHAKGCNLPEAPKSETATRAGVPELAGQSEIGPTGPRDPFKPPQVATTAQTAQTAQK